MKIFSLDPSLLDVGWAQVKGLTRDPESGLWHTDEADWSWGHWKIGSVGITNKFREVAEHIILTCDGIDAEKDWLVMEWPTYFGSDKGQVAAQMGFTLNLAGVCAYVAGFFRIPPERTFLLTATEWKGNVSKEVTRMRFFRALGQKKIYKINHNAVDAVMLLHTFCKRRKIVWNIHSSSVELEQTE